jgi:hypothetical protein
MGSKNERDTFAGKKADHIKLAREMGFSEKEIERIFGPLPKSLKKMNTGGLVTKNYVNPVTVVDNRKRK